MTPTALTDFQAMVKLTEGQYGFSYNDYAAKDGSDIWFTDWQGNVIPHEIDLWNASGASYIWVRVPELTGKSTSITMHWGEARTATQPRANPNHDSTILRVESKNDSDSTILHSFRVLCKRSSV